MARAINGLKIKPDIMLIDALTGLDINCPSKGVIHGDALCYSIGAASILAKVTRDRFMEDMHELYPEYNFAKNKENTTWQACHLSTFTKNTRVE